MSLLSGVLSGSGLVLSALGAALDPSHHPFKRSLTRPGGPGHRRDEEVGDWACAWQRPYVQKCVNVHKPKNAPKLVKIKKDYKKKYNKLYRAGKFPKAARFHKDVKAAGARYKPAKSKTWAARSAPKKRAAR